MYPRSRRRVFRKRRRTAYRRKRTRRTFYKRRKPRRVTRRRRRRNYAVRVVQCAPETFVIPESRGTVDNYVGNCHWHISDIPITQRTIWASQYEQLKFLRVTSSGSRVSTLQSLLHGVTCSKSCILPVGVPNCVIHTTRTIRTEK